MSPFNYDAIEKCFSKLLDLAATSFTASELQEVNDFLGAGEYGLALETFVDIVIEENKRISPAVCTVVKDLAQLMSIVEQIDLESIHRVAE